MLMVNSFVLIEDSVIEPAALLSTTVSFETILLGPMVLDSFDQFSLLKTERGKHSGFNDRRKLQED